MEETETPHPDYLKGFNEGYTISKHMPDLAAKIPNDLPSQRGQGFQHGRQQLQNEQNKERLPWLKSDRLSNLNKHIPTHKGKSKDGPDR